MTISQPTRSGERTSSTKNRSSLARSSPTSSDDRQATSSGKTHATSPTHPHTCIRRDGMTRSYPKPIREVFQDLEEKLGWTPRLDSIKRLGSETASSAQRSTSNERGTAEPRPSGSSASQLVTTETISADSPLRRPATVDELEGMILKLGLTTGHVVERHRAALIADALLHAGWTSAEVEAAYRTIVGSAKLMKEISFEDRKSTRLNSSHVAS